MNRYFDSNRRAELVAGSPQKPQDLRERNRRTMLELRSTRVSLQASAGQPILQNDAVVCRQTLFQRNDQKLLNPEKVVLRVYQRNPRLVKPIVSYQNEWNNIGEMSKKYCSLLLPEKVIHRQELSYIEKMGKAASTRPGNEQRTLSPATLRTTPTTTQKVLVNLSQTTPVKITKVQPAGLRYVVDESGLNSRNPFLANSRVAGPDAAGNSSIVIRYDASVGDKTASPMAKESPVAESSELSPDHFSQSHMNSLLPNEVLPQRSFRITQARDPTNRPSSRKRADRSFSDRSLSPAKLKTTKTHHQQSTTEDSLAIHGRTRTLSLDARSASLEKEVVLDAAFIRNFTIGRIDPLNEVNFKTSHFLKYIQQNSTLMKTHFASILERKKGRLGSTITGHPSTSVDRKSVDGALQTSLKPKLQTQANHKYRKPLRNPSEGEYLETAADISKDFDRVEQQVQYYKAVNDSATGFNAKKYFDTYKNTAGPGCNGLARIDFSHNFSNAVPHRPQPTDRIFPSESSRDLPRDSGVVREVGVTAEDIVLEREPARKSPFKIFTQNKAQALQH